MILLRVVIVGASGVGKSSIVTKFCSDTLAVGSSVLGCDFRTDTMDHKGSKYKLQIWDTPGNEESWTSNCCSADMIIIVYDVGKQSSFDMIDTFISQIKKYGKEDVPYAIVANKADLECWEVKINPKDTREALFFLETSCKTDLNIRELFQRVVECCHDAKQEQIEQIKLNDNNYSSLCVTVACASYKMPISTYNITFDGFLKNPCLTKIPYDLLVGVSEALVNCSKSGFLSMKGILMYHKYFFVLREDFLYWFKNNKNATCIDQLDLNSCISVMQKKCQYIHISYYSKSSGKIENMRLYAHNKKECEEWLNLLKTKQKEDTEHEDSHKPKKDMMPLNIIGRFQFRNDEEINVTISKQSNEECVLQCIPKWLLGLVFDFSASFQFPLKSFRYYKDTETSKNFLLISTDTHMRLWFRPKDERLFISKLISIFGEYAFGGMVTTSVLNETFKIIYKIACLQLHVSPVKRILDLIDESIKNKKSIHELCLRRCRIISQDIYAITHALSFYPGITLIDLRSTRMTSKGLVYLLKALCKYKWLQSLDFGQNEAIDSRETRSALQEYLSNAHLKCIKFMNTDVGNVTFDVFFQSLKTHKTLTDVDIAFNVVDDVNCDAISEVIIHNTKLEKLLMWHSHITDHGANVLINAVNQRPMDSPHLCLELHGSQYIHKETMKHFDECVRLKCQSKVSRKVKVLGQSSDFVETLTGNKIKEIVGKTSNGEEIEKEIEKLKLKEEIQSKEKVERKGLARMKSNLKNNYVSPLDDSEKMVAYVLDQKFIGERADGLYFSEILLDDHGKAKELWASCNRCDHPVLDVVAYYCNNNTRKNILADVNTALEECGFLGLVIEEEEIHPIQKVEHCTDLGDFDANRRQIFSMISTQIGFEARYLSHFLLDFDDILAISVANEGNVTAYTSDVLVKWYMRTRKELRTWKNLQRVLKFLGKGKLIEEIELEFKV
ncbi:uncharacterized protein LOC130625544 isoform X2 [Hydractinia symbiolongicarpus]|uniref:uncharacterized protein LOC130625544 isoform X2 n=1 Tax=Hydractinia symbiolongicarpus TaxID=13093 RepID=UPI00254F06AF|nr:uncharacterized protein LOC130625544 isoform X2 [Hydractinia symbiolongicarpus]